MLTFKASRARTTQRVRSIFATAAFVLLVLLVPQTNLGAARAPLSYPFCPCEFDPLGHFVAVGAVVFDTTALTYGGVPGGVEVNGIAVFVFDSITIPAGSTVTGVGSRPLALLSKTWVQVDGAVRLDGRSASNFNNGPFAGGAGGHAGGAGPGSNPGNGPGGGLPGVRAAGSGGAGFGGAGGNGGVPGFGGVSGPGGPAYGDVIVALEGGSGGASGTRGAEAGGGGGGGALLISAVDAINVAVTGVVSATGGAGAVSGQGGSGGGSGGAVVFFAPMVTNDGLVTANGGHGGAGGCCGAGGAGGGGRIAVGGVSAGVGSYTVKGGITGLGGGGFGPGAVHPNGNGADGLILIDEDLFPPCVTTVEIDIKPGSDPNSINPRSRGVQPVAILTTSMAAGDSVDFDASTVAGSTVTLGDDVGTDTPALRWNLEDVDLDGDLDLILHFSTQALVANGDLTPLTTELMLKGETFAGDPIEGTDAVRIVP